VFAYLDSSVLLRIVLRERSTLPEWSSIETGITSELARVECNRTLERLFLHGVFDEDEFLAKRDEIAEILERVTVVPLDTAVVTLAAGRLNLALRTLDTLHLMTAVAARNAQPAAHPTLTFATHDHQLALAARALGFAVIGA
jgi:predicted nucleic acid-binding protein